MKNVFYENLILGQIPIQNHEKQTKPPLAPTTISQQPLGVRRKMNPF